MRRFIDSLVRDPAASLLTLTLAVLPLPSHALVIGFQPTSTLVAEGDSFAVDVIVTDLAAAGEIVQAFDLFLDFDASIIAPTAVTFGPLATVTSDLVIGIGETFDLSTALIGVLGFGTGSLEISAVSLVPDLLPFLQGDTVLLATLTFDALMAGTTTLSFADHPLFGIPADVKGLDPFTPLTFGTIGFAVVAVSVPEPGTFGLLALGLLLLLPRVARRR